MKILEDRYPLGSLPNQKTSGRYIDGILHQNIKYLAKNITKDMTYLGIISSSTLEVGTGKSVFSQQLMEAYLDEINKQHGFDLKLTMDNIVFRPKDIIKRSFEVPRYSVIICDEWEDANYWSELGITLRQFFRKCRQLNLFMLIIIPNLFQLPMSYAISRSVFFIDVRFSGEFDRGYFSFYNFSRKKTLYIKGKKQQNYGIVAPNFVGRFGDGYAVGEDNYRKEKLEDLKRQEEQEKKPLTERQIKVGLFYKLYNHFKGTLTIEQLAKGFSITRTTGDAWLKEIREIEKSQNAKSTPPDHIVNNLTRDGDSGGEKDPLPQLT
ncbi:MAG: hypothetical protein ACTSQ4_02380 [Candidatus Heimdallarchaeaceae archaeon]